MHSKFSKIKPITKKIEKIVKCVPSEHTNVDENNADKMLGNAPKSKHVGKPDHSLRA